MARKPRRASSWRGFRRARAPSPTLRRQRSCSTASNATTTGVKSSGSRTEREQRLNLIMFTIALHVLIAVLGVGTIGALPLTARSARRAELTLSGFSVWWLALLRAARVSLFLAFASGALLDFLHQ